MFIHLGGISVINWGAGQPSMPEREFTARIGLVYGTTEVQSRLLRGCSRCVGGTLGFRAFGGRVRLHRGRPTTLDLRLILQGRGWRVFPRGLAQAPATRCFRGHLQRDAGALWRCQV
jgi:hypothetical protein